MGDFTVVRPRDDADAQQASDWCNDLVTELTKSGHTKIADVNDQTPPTTRHILNAFKPAALIFYFGHGDEHNWLTNQAKTLDDSNVSVTKGKAVVSIACKTACNLGPAAITAGAVAWLGFTGKVAVIRPHKTRDPIGNAIVGALACLGNRGTMQQARDEIAKRCDQLTIDYDTGQFSTHPEHFLGYFGSMVMRDHVDVQGTPSHRPL